MTDSRLADKFVLRLPDGLRDLYKQQAQLNGRSMNAEMVKVLQEGVDSAGSVEARLERLESLVAVEIRKMYSLVNDKVEEVVSLADYQALEMERKQLRRSIRQALVYVKETANASPIQRSNALEKVANELRREL